MKNLFSAALILTVLICFGMACQNNPLSGFTSKYNCTIAGEPEPKTSEDFYERARKHIAIFSGDSIASLDDCAMAALDEAIRLDPKNYKALYLRAFGFKQRKETQKAMADLEKAIEANTKYHEAYYQRSAIYADGKDYQNAIQEITKAIDSAPKYKSFLTQYYLDRGTYYSSNSQYEKALADFDEAIRLQPADSVLYMKRAEVYKELGKDDLALADKLQAEKLKNKTATSDSKPPELDSGDVLNGKAVNLAKPAYPPAAKAVRAKGEVKVQVTIDENGKVVSATAVSGHPFLRRAAEAAAKESKFAPTMLNGQKIKVTGILVFNFEGE